MDILWLVVRGNRRQGLGVVGFKDKVFITILEVKSYMD
jgi:hypothetical protein